MSNKLPALPSVAGALINEGALAFSDRSDLTYRYFNCLSLKEISAKQSLLTGSIFADSVISECDFSRCDFEGSQFVRSKIADSKFCNCDIRSSRFTSTSFVRCDFGNALFSYCEFDQCEFIDCSFEQASLSEIKAKNTLFSKCRTPMATFIHGEFSHCQFARMKLADCTFMLHIFDGCTFSECGINVDSLGAVYGISKKDISTFSLFYLGVEQSTPDISNIIRTVFEEFVRRRWRFKLVMLAWNMGEIPPVTAIRALMGVFRNQVDEGVFLQSEEIRFLRRITEHLTETNRMPFIAATEGYEQIIQLVREASAIGDHPHAELSQLALKFLAAIEAMQPSLDRLAADFMSEAGNNNQITIWIRFDHRPETGTATFINAISIPLGLPPSAWQLREYEGSYIEWVQATVASLFAFRLVLFAINGCVKEADNLVKNVLNFGQKRQSKSPGSKVASRGRSANKIVKTLQASDVLSDGALKGYDSVNILECKTLNESDIGAEKSELQQPGKRRRRAPNSP